MKEFGSAGNGVGSRRNGGAAELAGAGAKATPATTAMAVGAGVSEGGKEHRGKGQQGASSGGGGGGKKSKGPKQEELRAGALQKRMLSEDGLPKEG